MENINDFGDKSIIITRKIQVKVDIPKGEREKVRDAYQKLYNWQDIAFKASNIISSHLFVQENIKDFTYLSENIKVKLANLNFDNDGILNTSRQNSTYRVISQKFKNELPSSIATCLNHTIYSNYIKEKDQYFSGERSIRSYKKNLPVPFESKNVYDLRFDEKIKNFRFLLFKEDKYSIPFRTFLGGDLNNSKVVIERCISGKYKLCESAYRFEKKKLFFYFKIQQPVIVDMVDSNTVAQIELSFLAPLCIKFNGKEFHIGDSGSYIYKRQAIQQGLRHCMKIAKFNRGGEGRNRKLTLIKRFKKKEKNFISLYTHYISKELIKFCLANRIGKIEMKEIAQVKDEVKDMPLVLRNWSFGRLLNKISYKCKTNNIEIVTI